MTEVKCYMTWKDVYARVHELKLWAHSITNKKDLKVFGVPRGGAIVAALVGHAVDNPKTADIIVDDVIATGATLAKWKNGYPRKPFAALVNKLEEPDKSLGWVVFPWEVGVDESPASNITRVLEFLGDSPTREGLKDTPKRVLDMLLELTEGLRVTPPRLTVFTLAGCSEMVLMNGIRFSSLCEHHLLPFVGTASIAYIPNKASLHYGASKLARALDHCARRPQTQEVLANQVADMLSLGEAKPQGVGVILRATHQCMACRGVRQPDVEMVTSALRGSFLEDPSVRAEFLKLAR